MGTRNLTCVFKNEEYKVAQYGQWDGYPEGQGTTILDFLHKVNIDEFRNAMDECSWITEDEVNTIDNEIKTFNMADWKKYYPELSRDTGGDILNLILFKNKRKLQNSLDFANDSLFCEWAYVVDLDKDTFEVYRGFNKERLSESERFFNIENNQKEYKPVSLVKSFDLNNLPTKEEFLNEFKDESEEEQ